LARKNYRRIEKIQLFKNEEHKGEKMKKIAVVGCGAYMDSGYGCPGEWRCLKAAALGEGKFEEPSSVVTFVKCECTGRSLVPNTGMAIKLSEIEPDKIYLSSCLVNARPDCPYSTAEEKAEMLENKTGIKVVMGTHDYH
jgi:predicted metal-binding protein